MLSTRSGESGEKGARKQVKRCFPRRGSPSESGEGSTEQYRGRHNASFRTSVLGVTPPGGNSLKGTSKHAEDSSQALDSNGRPRPRDGGRDDRTLRRRRERGDTGQRYVQCLRHQRPAPRGEPAGSHPVGPTRRQRRGGRRGVDVAGRGSGAVDREHAQCRFELHQLRSGHRDDQRVRRRRRVGGPQRLVAARRGTATLERRRRQHAVFLLCARLDRVDHGRRSVHRRADDQHPRSGSPSTRASRPPSSGRSPG